MKKRILLSIMLTALSLSAFGCAAKTETTAQTEVGTELSQAAEGSSVAAESSSESGDFAALVEAAKGKELTFYMWGGDDKLNNWIDGYYANRLKEKYDIDLRRVPMNIEDVLSQLSGEYAAGIKEGDVDMIWINGENFKTAKENNFL